MPCWQLRTLCLYAGPVALDNVLCSSVDVHKGWLDSFSFGCLNVGVFPHLLLVYSTFVLGGGGGCHDMIMCD